MNMHIHSVAKPYCFREANGARKTEAECL